MGPWPDRRDHVAVAAKGRQRVADTQPLAVTKRAALLIAAANAAWQGRDAWSEFYLGASLTLPFSIFWPFFLLLAHSKRLAGFGAEIIAWLRFGSFGFVFGFALPQLALAFGRPLILSDLRVARRDLTLAFGFVLASFFTHLIDSKSSLGSFCEISPLSGAARPRRDEGLGPSVWARPRACSNPPPANVEGRLRSTAWRKRSPWSALGGLGASLCAGVPALRTLGVGGPALRSLGVGGRIRHPSSRMGPSRAVHPAKLTVLVSRRRRCCPLG